MKKYWFLLLLSLVLTGCAQKTQTTSEDIRMGMAYYASHSDDAICIATVAVKDDVIVSATIDEITYLSNDEFKGLPNTQSDASFGSQTDASKNLSSKVQNDEAYSGLMKANGATHGIKENYQAICDYVVGKNVEDLKREVTGKTDEEVIDAVSGCTLKSTKGYLQAIIEACKQV